MKLLPVHCAWALAVASLLGACSGESAPVDPANSTRQVESAVDETGLGADAVLAVALGTAAVPVRVGFTLSDKPQPGRPTKVTIALASSEDLDQLQLTANSRSLTIDAASASFQATAVRTGAVARHVVQVTPQQAGLADIELTLSAKRGEAVREAVFSVPVLVEAPSAAK